MGKASAVVHCNRSLDHQVRYAEAVKSGFVRHGYITSISYTPEARGDVHIIIGPWFAYHYWKNNRTLMLDRAYWDDPKCVAVHWLNGGEKIRLHDMPDRPHPELQPMKRGNHSIYLCDYGQHPDCRADTIRYHPSAVPPQESLPDALKRHQIAIGRRTTALVDAAIQGLETITNDPHSPVYGLTDRGRWINDLAWHNWSYDEIATGEFLDGIGHND